MTIRRLIVCFDGTWNTPDSGSKPTNVVKFLRAIQSVDQDISQFAFYDKGVGTGGLTDRIVGGASGVGLTNNVIDGYRFLGNNYAADDEIYIFGFSRGAYTARSLAGLVGLAGILKPSHLGIDLKNVSKIYRNVNIDRVGKLKAIDELNLDRYPIVPIRCVGVWDTVGSLGVPGDLGRQLYLRPYQFHDVQLSSRVDVALHAVAIDEKRSAFAPTLWVSKDGRPTRKEQIVEQVWFSGVHSNVGGSYEEAGLSDITLDWMVKRVKAHTDLAFNYQYLKDNCDPKSDGIGYESRSALYASSKLYPYQRLINQTTPGGSGIGEWFRKKFKTWDRRNIVPNDLHTINEMLHVSALERWKLPGVLHDAKKGKGKKQPYCPVNLEAVIRTQKTPVVDWNGEPIKANVLWP